jgi:hypothetical protein
MIATREHMLDMRRFGQALVGFDKVVTVGIFALAEGRLPRRNERLPFNVLAGEPKANCVSFLAALGTGAQQAFPFAMSVFQAATADFLWNWISFAFKRLGGRMREADPHFLRLMELTESFRSGELADRERMRQFMLKVLEHLRPNAGGVTGPLGESSSSVSFIDPDSGSSTTLGIPEATAVRSKEPMEVGDMEIMTIQIDGLTKHSRRATVINMADPNRYIPAEIRDPLFDVTPNDYTDALGTGASLRVLATPTYRSGELFRLYIMGIERAEREKE